MTNKQRDDFRWSRFDDVSIFVQAAWLIDCVSSVDPAFLVVDEQIAARQAVREGLVFA